MAAWASPTNEVDPAGTDECGEAEAVRRAARAYEQALVDGDTAAAAGWFDTAAPVSRFGPEGAQLGPDEVAHVRAATAPVPEAELLHEEVRPLAPGVVIYLAVLRRSGSTTSLQRTQVWTRHGSQWYITHAHVSRPSGPDA